MTARETTAAASSPPHPAGFDLTGRLALESHCVFRDAYDEVQGPGDITIVHVVNAPSPAATASLAIGDKVSERVLERLDG